MLRFFRVPMIILNGLCKWFAVPLSATQAPVTGLTDILTPVNLLPNSDFSRAEGGYATNFTISTTTRGTYYYPNPFWLFRPYASLSDVTITNGRGNFRIQGTVTGTTDSVIEIHPNMNFNSGRTYTFTFKYTNNGTNGNVRLAAYGTSEAVYFNGSDTLVCSFDSSADARRAIIYIENLSVGTFDITLHNMCAYEGEFKNPPSSALSLDVNPYNQFLLSYINIPNYNTYTPIWKNLGKVAGLDVKRFRVAINYFRYTGTAATIFTIGSLYIYGSNVASSQWLRKYDIKAAVYMHNKTATLAYESVTEDTNERIQATGASNPSFTVSLDLYNDTNTGYGILKASITKSYSIWTNILFVPKFIMAPMAATIYYPSLIVNESRNITGYQLPNGSSIDEYFS